MEYLVQDWHVKSVLQCFNKLILSIKECYEGLVSWRSLSRIYKYLTGKYLAQP